MVASAASRLDLSQLDPAVRYFCDKGVADSTHKTYQSALRRFATFCSLYSIISPFPVSESLLCYFSSYLACQNLSPQTIKTYLAGIRHTQITLGLPDPKEFSSLSRLKQVQAGIQRTHVLRLNTSRIRLPITPAVLHQLRAHWNQTKAEPCTDAIMLWAAATLCFFGFFRSGEITVPSQAAFTSSQHLAWGDIAVDNRSCPTLLKVHLKRSKCDQLGKGVDVFIGCTDDLLCPVAAVLAYMANRGATDGPFFIRTNGTPLTKPYFVAKVREALMAAGLPYQHFAGHSFRIGAATTAAKAGLEDSTICTLGRWNSTAFLTYIRTPREQLAQLSRTLSHS